MAKAERRDRIDTEQSFLSHLVELRDRLMRSIVIVFGSIAMQEHMPGGAGQDHAPAIQSLFGPAYASQTFRLERWCSNWMELQLWQSRILNF